MDWADFAARFDHDHDGFLPDGVVVGTSVEDWQAVLDLVERRGWRCRYRESGGPITMATAESIFAGSDSCARLRVHVSPAVEPIFRFRVPGRIDFDVDLRPITGPAELAELCAFLTDLGRTVGRPVTLLYDTPFGDAFMGYRPDVDRVVPL